MAEWIKREGRLLTIPKGKYQYMWSEISDGLQVYKVAKAV